MIPDKQITKGTIVEVMQGKSVYLSADPDMPLTLRAGPHSFAVPLNYLAILGRPLSKRGRRKSRKVVPVAWGSQKLWASYKDLRYGTKNIQNT
jgi:hypothetical protein